MVPGEDDAGEDRGRGGGKLAAGRNHGGAEVVFRVGGATKGNTRAVKPRLECAERG